VRVEKIGYPVIARGFSPEAIYFLFSKVITDQAIDPIDIL
jgi:hypothetical protein